MHRQQERKAKRAGHLRGVNEVHRVSDAVHRRRANICRHILKRSDEPATEQNLEAGQGRLKRVDSIRPRLARIGRCCSLNDIAGGGLASLCTR